MGQRKSETTEEKGHKRCQLSENSSMVSMLVWPCPVISIIVCPVFSLNSISKFFPRLSSLSSVCVFGVYVQQTGVCMWCGQ